MTGAKPTKTKRKPISLKRMRGATGWGSAFLWVILGCVSIVSAITVGITPDGRARLAILDTPAANRASVPQPKTPELASLENEVTRLRAEARRAAIEKTALSNRLASLEEQLDTPVTTASIPQAPKTTSDPALSDQQQNPLTVSYGNLPKISDSDGSVMSVEQIRAGLAQNARELPSIGSARPMDTQSLMQTSFAIEVANATTLADLRERWDQISKRHAPDMGGFDPLVAVRETVNGSLELRLLAGPITNAADAIRLCVRIREFGTDCTPVSYEGQRLALR